MVHRNHTKKGYQGKPNVNHRGHSIGVAFWVPEFC